MTFDMTTSKVLRRLMDERGMKKHRKRIEKPYGRTWLDTSPVS